MVQIKNELTIKKPRNDTFSFISHFENIPLWNYYVRSVKKVSEHVEGKGTIYHQVRKHDEQKFRITRYDPPNLITIETIEDSTPQFRRTISLSQKGNRTQLHDNFEIETGSPNVVERLLKNRMKSAVNENLSKLKELLETGITVLPDGRTVNIQ